MVMGTWSIVWTLQFSLVLHPTDNSRDLIEIRGLKRDFRQKHPWRPQACPPSLLSTWLRRPTCYSFCWQCFFFCLTIHNIQSVTFTGQPTLICNYWFLLNIPSLFLPHYRISSLKYETMGRFWSSRQHCDVCKPLRQQDHLGRLSVQNSLELGTPLNLSEGSTRIQNLSNYLLMWGKHYLAFPLYLSDHCSLYPLHHFLPISPWMDPFEFHRNFGIHQCCITHHEYSVHTHTAHA